MNGILNNLSGRSNKFYLSLTAISLIFTLLLNFYAKISECSLIFTFLALTLNVISSLQGTKKAMKSIILSVSISFALLWNLKYYIQGELISGLVFASLVSVLASSYIGLNLFSRLKLKYNFYVSNFISLLAYAIIDGAVMSLFFINIFSVNRVFSIFAYEVTYKCVYGFSACVCLFVLSYLHKQFKTVQN